MTIHRILHYLGLTENYKGYWQLYSAIRLAYQNPKKLTNIVKEIYEVVAQEYNCSVYCIERNIRTLILKIWVNNKEELFAITQITLSTPPTVSNFISFIIFNILRKHL